MTIEIEMASDFNTTELTTPIAQLIASGFKDKFTHKLFSKTDIKKISLAMSHVICTQHKDNLIIAKKEKKVCGCLYFIGPADKNLVTRDIFKSHLSFFQRTKLFLLLVFLAHSPKKKETHIDFLSVLPEYSGIGIAKNLINYCRKINDSNRITLYVASENTAAFNLYKKTKFNIIQTVSSNFGNWLTGIKTWHYMKWGY